VVKLNGMLYLAHINPLLGWPRQPNSRQPTEGSGPRLSCYNYNNKGVHEEIFLPSIESVMQQELNASEWTNGSNPILSLRILEQHSFVSRDTTYCKVGVSLAPLILGEALIRERLPLTMVPAGVVVLVGGVEGASRVDGDVHVVSPLGNHLWRHKSVGGTCGRLWWLDGGLHMVIAWGPMQSGVASTIYDDESQWHGATGSW
jgi:hypothetical protein